MAWSPAASIQLFSWGLGWDSHDQCLTAYLLDHSFRASIFGLHEACTALLAWALWIPDSSVRPSRITEHEHEVQFDLDWQSSLCACSQG